MCEALTVRPEVIASAQEAGDSEACARAWLMASRNSVMWIALIVTPAVNGSSVKTGPLWGTDGAPASLRADREASLPAPRSVGGESERDSAPSLTVGFP